MVFLNLALALASEGNYGAAYTVISSIQTTVPNETIDQMRATIKLRQPVTFPGFLKQDLFITYR